MSAESVQPLNDLVPAPRPCPGLPKAAVALLLLGAVLCLAAMFVLLAWPQVWERISTIFLVPWLIPGVMAVCMVVMALLLLGMRLLRQALSK